MDDEELEMDKSRLREIENNLEALIKEHYQLAVDVCASGDNFNERISKLERHYVYQIDENRKISRRVDELELVLPPNQAGLQNVYDEFKLITGNGFFRDYKKHFDAISDTLDNLTKFVMTIEDRIKRLEKMIPKPPCQHEWNTGFLLTSNPAKMQCKKCNEYITVGQPIYNTSILGDNS